MSFFFVCTFCDVRVTDMTSATHTYHSWTVLLLLCTFLSCRQTNASRGGALISSQAQQPAAVEKATLPSLTGPLSGAVSSLDPKLVADQVNAMLMERILASAQLYGNHIACIHAYVCIGGIEYVPICRDRVCGAPNTSIAQVTKPMHISSRGTLVTIKAILCETVFPQALG